MKISSSKSRSSTRIAWFFLLLILIPTISPLGFLVDVPVAYAQCPGGSCGGSSGSAASSAGLLSGLLGGGGGGIENMMMIMMLVSMLMQLFQGLGGSTPQTGTAEENPSQSGNVGPTNTGYNDGGYNDGYNDGNVNTSSGLASQSIFLAGSGSDQAIAPATLNITKGNGFNFFNTSDVDQEVRIYKNGNTDLQADKIVTTGNVEVFNFQNAGMYKVCVVNNGTDSCKTTVTVQ